ncbi:MAG: hypothetical protein D6687_09535 [Acidobacteria bacterium]|nr:MAG: hypothetical protein D6687_09535 [Acidobacteriota bacterium]
MFLPALSLGQEIVDSFKIKNLPYSFVLLEKDGKCVLRYTKGDASKELVMDILPKCKVVREIGSGEVVHYYYDDIEATVIAIGGEVKKERCAEETAFSQQVVLIRRNNVKLGEKVNDWTCLPGGDDEKNYWTLSHPINKKTKVSQKKSFKTKQPTKNSSRKKAKQ